MLSTFSQPHPWNWSLDCKRWETTDSNPPGPMKLSSQSTAGVRLSCAFCQPQYPLLKCWAKTILLIQTSTFWLFFIQNILYSALVEFLLELWAISSLTYFHQDSWNHEAGGMDSQLGLTNTVFTLCVFFRRKWWQSFTGEILRTNWWRLLWRSHWMLL
jgi:hypothetical protein